MSTYRVLLRMQVVPGKEESFERAWRDGARTIAEEPANVAQWLSRSDDENSVYYIVSDWVDERSFREYEVSERHRLHREKLHPYRSAGSMTTMTVVDSTAGRGVPR
ncbi:MAG TPA: antibiotic biosynthesis monooxygenase family protein [Micromonosporaceae bacterium]|nr:antibiotic biosynthesis monooxygenase family protein [Micromonosporaceae bacterium]